MRQWAPMCPCPTSQRPRQHPREVCVSNEPLGVAWGPVGVITGGPQSGRCATHVTGALASSTDPAPPPGARGAIRAQRCSAGRAGGAHASHVPRGCQRGKTDQVQTRGVVFDVCERLCGVLSVPPPELGACTAQGEGCADARQTPGCDCAIPRRLGGPMPRGGQAGGPGGI